MTSSDYPDRPAPAGTLTDTDPTYVSTSGDSPGMKDQARDAAGTAADQARSTAGTAAEEGKHVASVAKGEAAQVASEAKAQVQNVLSDAMSQVQDQSRTQRDRLVGTLQTFGDDLEQMASQGGRSGLATDLARQVASRSRDLSNRLDGREPQDMVEDVRDFARRKPGVFLLGAVAAGVLAGRMTRGAKSAQSGGSTGTGQSMTTGERDVTAYGVPGATTYERPTPGTASGTPLAGASLPRQATPYTSPAATGPTTEGTATFPEEPATGADPWIGEPGRGGTP